LLRRIENFNPPEIEVALELINEALSKPEQSSYRCIVALETKANEEIYLGYICFGRTPMTDFTYDLYWVAVDPAFRGRGLGGQLLHAMDESLRHSGGRVIRVETSSMETYHGSLKFYLNEGFEIAGRIPNFYREKDDLVILFKTL